MGQRRGSSKFCSKFWVTDSDRVIDDHPTQPNSVTMEKWRDMKDSMEYLNDRTWRYHGMNAFAMKMRSSVLNRFWRNHTSDKNGHRGDMPPYVQRPSAAVPNAAFSFAMAVMDKVEGWNEEEWVGSNFAASMWIFTKAALCDVRGRDPPLDLQPILRIIVESVSCVTEDFLSEPEWITETNVNLKENDIMEALDYDIDVPFPLQW